MPDPAGDVLPGGVNKALKPKAPGATTGSRNAGIFAGPMSLPFCSYGLLAFNLEGETGLTAAAAATVVSRELSAGVLFSACCCRAHASSTCGAQHHGVGGLRSNRRNTAEQGVCSTTIVASSCPGVHRLIYQKSLSAAAASSKI